MPDAAPDIPVVRIERLKKRAEFLACAQAAALAPAPCSSRRGRAQILQGTIRR
jgi:hypothetical protein